MENENASFWLPSYFLTDHHDKLHLKTTRSYNNKFSYDLFSDNDENSLDDDTSFLSHLTNNLARTSLLDTNRPLVYSTSPQSTLTGPSRVPSPPLTPELKNDAAWELLYEAAGQVARLKMNAIAAQINTRSLLGVPRHTTNKHQNRYCNHHQQRVQESAWTRQQQERQTMCGTQMRVIGQKRQSVGTGVFIPRKVPTSPPRHHHHHHHHYQYQPQSNTELCRRQTEIMMERRNAILGQQRRNTNSFTRTENMNNLGHAHSHEIRLPTDWTY